MRGILAIAALAGWLAPVSAWCQARPIPVVAAENFYGDIAEQIGGGDVAVSSILSNPDQDPHLFEASPSVAKRLAAARIVICNGIDYDPWITKLLRASPGRDRTVIVAADLVGRKSGDNPHVWYDPATMSAVAASFADAASTADPSHAAGYRQRLEAFRTALQPVQARIGAMRRRLSGVPATATEPVFGYMFAALGMIVRNERFQLAVMNDTEPAAGDIAAFEDDLRSRQVRLLVYNSQASSPIAARMERLAKAAGVPVVGATETEPAGLRYQAWMLKELEAVDRALPE